MELFKKVGGEKMKSYPAFRYDVNKYAKVNPIFS